MSSTVLEVKRKAWDVIFQDPNLSLNSLTHRAISGTVCQNGLRSVCWKVFLGYLPTLEISTWPSLLLKERQHYTELKRKFIDEPAEKMNQSNQDQDLSDNNPLALSDNNPWQQYFADSEIRKIIRQDVERTFPDIEFFRQEEAQQRLTDILFIYCKLNREVSYRQGMHELLAPFYWILTEESLDATQLDINPVDPTNKVIVQLLDSNYAEHDAYILFDRLMKYGKSWYEFNEQLVPTKRDSMPSKPDIRSNPIVAICHRIHHQHLRTIDPYLYRHLENFSIEPQLYGIRWIRLLFGREFEIHELLKLWDAIFAEDRTLEIVEYVCLAMLLRMRDQLLNKDYAECLSMLMRPSELMKPAGLVEQARYLKDNLTEETALQILQQLDVRSGRDPRPSMSAGVPELNIQTPVAKPNRTLSHRASQSSNLDGFSRLTSNMMRNPQMRDLNRAIAGVMGTVQKNVNTFNENVLGKPQDQLSRRSTVSSEFPSGFDRVAATTTTHQVYKKSSQNTKLADEQLARMTATNAEMGELMARCISLLEGQMFPALDSSRSPSIQPVEETASDLDIASYDSHNSDNEDESKKQKDEKEEKQAIQQPVRPLQDDATIIMALVGLKHVRDVLTGKQTHFDSSVLDFKSSTKPKPSTESKTEPVPKKKEDDWKWDLVDAKEATVSKTQSSPKRATVFVPPQTTSPLLSAEAPLTETPLAEAAVYVPHHPTPPKQPIKYRIEDLLSDPDLQIPSPKANNTKFKWILENDKPSPVESPTTSYDLFKSDQAKLSPRKRNSFILKKQSSQLDIVTKSSLATVDPLDASNVDSRKTYEYDVL